jgi:hypothetical protein
MNALNSSRTAEYTNIDKSSHEVVNATVLALKTTFLMDEEIELIILDTKRKIANGICYLLNVVLRLNTVYKFTVHENFSENKYELISNMI